MSPYVPIVAVMAAQVILRLINVAGVIWRERERARSHRAQMETAASSGTMLCERLGNGDAMLIIPGAGGREQILVAELLSRTVPGKPASPGKPAP